MYLRLSLRGPNKFRLIETSPQTCKSIGSVNYFRAALSLVIAAQASLMEFPSSRVKSLPFLYSDTLLSRGRGFPISAQEQSWV